MTGGSLRVSGFVEGDLTLGPDVTAKVQCDRPVRTGDGLDLSGYSGRDAPKASRLVPETNRPGR